MNLNFTNWHPVPQDAVIPKGTPYWRYDSEESLGRYYGHGVDYDIGPAERWSDSEYYTEEPILSPEEEKIEKRARAMYYSMPDSAEWEYEPLDIQEAWLDLARKYVEK